MTEKDGGVYSPPPDQYDRFDVGEEDDSRRGPLLLVVAIAVLIAFAAVIYTAYHQGIRSGGRDDAPLIAAETSPVKTVPSDPGGKPSVDSDNAAYDPLDGNAEEREVAIAAPPEQPIERAPERKPDPEPETNRQPDPVVTQPAPVVRSTIPVQSDGRYVVQLGAFRSEEQALDSWGKLRNRLPVVMDVTTADVQRADLGAKGIYYRLRAAAFGDRTTASAFCNALKAKGQDCIVVSR